MPQDVHLNRFSPSQDVDPAQDLEHPQPHAKNLQAMPGAGGARAVQGSDISPVHSLPTLAVPSGPLDLESLMDSLGFTSRRNACRQGLDSISANAATQKVENDKVVAEMRTNLEKMEEARKLQGLMKILGVLALVVAVVVTVATLGTAGPIMAGISIALLALTITSYATDGKIGIAGLFSLIGEKCGMSEQDSKLFGTIMEIVVIIATLGAGIGCSLAKGAATAGAQVAKGAQTAIKASQQAAAKVGTEVAQEASKKLVANLDKLAAQAVKGSYKLTTGLVQASTAAKEATHVVAPLASIPSNTAMAVLKGGLGVLLPGMAKQVAFIAQVCGAVVGGATSVAKGVTGIETANAEADATTAKANVRHLEALLAMLREFADMERAMVKAELERCTALMAGVMNIVNANNDAQQRILSNSPAMA